MTFFKRKLDDKKPVFWSVAIATLLAGVTILALGLVELGYNVFGSSNYSSPMSKIIGGLIVMSLGYIHMTLELIRVKK